MGWEEKRCEDREGWRGALERLSERQSAVSISLSVLISPSHTICLLSFSPLMTGLRGGGGGDQEGREGRGRCRTANCLAANRFI